MKNQNQIVKQNQENLRQARAIFDFRLNLLKLSIITSFASILLMYSGKVPVEKVEAAQAVICRIVLLTFKVTKDVNNRLDDENKDSD
jgi:hypothetical protein